MILKLLLYLHNEKKSNSIRSILQGFSCHSDRKGNSKSEICAFIALGTEDRLPIKFIKVIRDGLYELRISYNGNIYRIFFIFDEGQIVVLFNGFHKKTQKTPSSEIDKALKIKEEYYEYKKTTC